MTDLVDKSAVRTSANNEDNSPQSGESPREEVPEAQPVESSSGKKRKHSDDSEPSKFLKVEGEHTKVVAKHYNTLEEKGLSERNKSRIFYLRNFNNWIKSMLVNEYVQKVKDSLQVGAPLRVLDMCCGKGGDLLKWQKGGISHLICTDIAEVSIEQCQARYNALISRSKRFAPEFTAEFFACDSTLNRLRERYRDASIDLNIVSCQFAFHYCFESLPQAECMIRNASECLKPGGFFIGTIPDANEIMRRQKLSDSDTFGNDVYSITFQCDTEKPPLFGAKYNFHLEDVVDCPEFLVHFPTLVKLARNFGLELVMRERFGDFYKRMIPRGRGLIEKMQALETYPAFREGNLNSSTPHDYSHAQDFMDRVATHGRGPKKIGTLSKSEWEAASLYLVFAFRKMKKVWNKEGKPEYIQ
ncbi:mRNA cap guanine-N7 methyltransferase [Phlebotomus argentipes]|uniref:mRNA cap guanine-N7 methyltransferase n=1 Tax=Phlebotomus argentipes TaxID=94469 RepID=UPI0028933D64|nr:mRNA cap guanine-N7 methyltransferase [Phlebotomus argentipes]